MKFILKNQNVEEIIGIIHLNLKPELGEWIEFKNSLYAIHRIIHSEEGIRLVVLNSR